MTPVFRKKAKVEINDLQELAASLRRIRRESLRILRLLNGRAYMQWIDPLLTSGDALLFFERLRSSLDEEESKRFDSINLFYGGQVPCERCVLDARWLVWNEPVDGPCSDLSVLCQEHQVRSKVMRTRELTQFATMTLSELRDFLVTYSWNPEDLGKILALWSEGAP